MKFLQKLLKLLKPANLALFLKIWICIPIFKLLLMKMNMPVLLKSLDRNSDTRKSFENQDKEFAELAWGYTNFILIKCLRSKKPCLLRSLILFYLFRKKALDVKIHFGIKKNVSPFEGHSWLLLNGAYFLENPDPHVLHTDMYSYPSENVTHSDPVSVSK